MICIYCERHGDWSTLVGSLGEYAHPACIEEQRRSRELVDQRTRIAFLTRENERLRNRAAELERLLAPQPPMIDPHDPDGGEDDDVRCPHGGRYLRGH